MADSETHMIESSEETCAKFKYTTFETNFSITENKVQESISLQEAFRRYKEAKQDELRQARLLRKRQELRKADPQKMATLRQKFINQAKKYYGYPYARKYWPPDSPEYKSKLFLDCCGLVRRVMRDLAEDFGFIIGPWNQAYMFDTLPMVVESEKDMKPGDLVFISATYYNPKSKKQRHNMTHVEIWAGEGCKTIGARWNNGKVQMWDHYKFLAKSYHSETYHFRSIDTWLKGICRSHCSQHSWRRSKYNPSKKSIFALPEQIDEDEAAGDDDDNVDTFNMRGNTFISQVSSVNKMLEHCKLSVIERPKTELDSPFVQNDSPRLKQKADFPAIRNDLRGKGKTHVNKQKKAKNVNEARQKGHSSLQVPENEGEEERCDSNTTLSSGSAGADNNLLERNKEHGQLTLSRSLNDLGRKGLYLRDLVDSQITNSNDEDKEGDFDADEQNAEEEDLEETEENDYDDDYFIFINDDEDSDDEKNPNSEHSDDSSEFIMGEEIESDTEKATNGENADKILAEGKNSENSNLGAFEKKSSNDKIKIEESHNEEEKVKADLEKEKAGESKPCISGQNITDCFFDAHNQCEGTDNLGVKKTSIEEKRPVKVNIIETVIPFGTNEAVKSPTLKQCGNHENTNLNAYPKVSDKCKERSRGQCLKASVITVVSQSDSSVSKVDSISSTFSPSCSQASSISQAGVSSKMHTGTSQHESSCFPENDMPVAFRSQTGSASPFILPTESETSEESTTRACTSSQSKCTQELSKSASGTELTTNSNTQNGTSRAHSGKIDSEKNVGARMTKLPACSRTNKTPTFYIGGCNGVSLVEGPLTSLGWKRITDKNDQRFKLKWVESKARIDYQALKEGEQLVNHLPNSQLLTNKMGLLNSLKEYERVTLSTKGRLPRLRMSDFHPETYKLDEKVDRDMFLDVYKDDEIWICKPTGWNQGKGIFLIRSREEVKEVLEEQVQKKQLPKMAVSRIVQRYITNPLLLDGRKFDIRAYMLIASTVPFLILYHKGYVRLCCHKYDADTTDLGRHLTNQYVQKKDPSYEKLKETTAWSMDKFNTYINEEVRPDCPVEIEEDWVYNTFTRQVQKIMIHLFNSVKHKLESKKGYFDLFGLDFMVDSNMKVQLIEVNTNPALACNCKALKQVIPGVVEESLYLAIECLEKCKKNQPLMPLKSLKNFTVLYCGSHGNTSSQNRNTQQMKEDKNTENKKLLPSLQAQRSLTKNAPIYATNQQGEAEKAKSVSVSVTSSKEISATRSHDDPDSSQTSGKPKRNVIFNNSGMNEKTRELTTSEKNHTKNRQNTSGNNEKKLSESESEKGESKRKENDAFSKPLNDLNKDAVSPGQSSQNELQRKITQTEDLRSKSRQSLRMQDKLQRGN